MKLGFTGTQNGMTAKQMATFIELYKLLDPDEFHHGDCIGADCEAHDIAKYYGTNVVIHPPVNNSKRAFCLTANELRKPKNYLERNHDIVDDTDVMIATPKEKEEQLRSGTWATYRYAKKQNKPTIIIYPDGTRLVNDPNKVLQKLQPIQA